MANAFGGPLQHFAGATYRVHDQRLHLHVAVMGVDLYGLLAMASSASAVLLSVMSPRYMLTIVAS